MSEHPSPKDMLDLTGKVALVTGAGQGVGESTARYLAAHGASVAVNDYFLDRAEAVAADIRADGGHAIGVQADVTQFESVMAMAECTARELGTVTVLVNNAGNAGAGNTVGLRPFWESDPPDWEPYLAVNLDGVLFCCRAFVPGMIEAGHGRLITIISDAARVGEARLEVYSAAKAGAAGLMRGLARSLGRYNITANSVAIGFTNTPATAAAASPEVITKVLSNYMIRRAGEPTDAAAMVTFLASGASSWITGQTYPVNGGFSVSQ